MQQQLEKMDEDFARKSDFKDIKFPVTITAIRKIGKKCITIVFLVMKIDKNS